MRNAIPPLLCVSKGLPKSFFGARQLMFQKLRLKKFLEDESKQFLKSACPSLLHHCIGYCFTHRIEMDCTPNDSLNNNDLQKDFGCCNGQQDSCGVVGILQELASLFQCPKRWVGNVRVLEVK